MNLDTLKRLESAAIPTRWHFASSRNDRYAITCDEYEICYGVNYEDATLICAMRNALPELIAEIERLRELTTWQPIETAPKDGTLVQLYAKDEPIIVGAWRHLGGDMWSEWECPYTGYSIDATHWRPRPELPEEKVMKLEKLKRLEAAATPGPELIAEIERLQAIVEIQKQAIEQMVDELVIPVRWRPIETAPKDGREILVYCPSRGVVQDGFFADGQWWGIFRTGSWKIDPTVWMTKPEPPEEEGYEGL
jgi:hypothetical protein